MKRIVVVLLILLWVPPGATAGILSAQFIDGGSIRVITGDGRTLIVPNDVANRHRGALQKWVNSGNTIAPADPPPVKTRQERIRRDPTYPSADEFMEAQLHCRYDSDCSGLDAIHFRIKQLESKYP